jgi:Uncharacterized protein conserved in bacteria (DUF2213)
MQRKAIQFTTNLQSSMVSFTTHDGKEYLVAPCVALVPGVLNGDLVTLESVTNTFYAWNGRPVVLDHPYDDNGVPVSANDTTILANAGLGAVWNADVDDNRLRLQIWLDTDKCRKLGGDAQRVIDAVKRGDSVEVSTGYWATMRVQRGVYNNREYNAVTDHILPDHLALLPNSIGACNWGDGCGAPRFNQQEVKMDERTLIEAVTDSFRKLIPHLAFKDVATKSLCQACTSIHAQAEEDDDPKPESEQNPEPEAESSENSEQEESQGNGENDKPEGEEEAMMDVTTQQADTLSMFLNEHRISQGNLIEAIQLRNNRRQEWADVLKTNAGLSDEDIIGMPDKVLEKLANTYSAQEVDEKPLITDNQAAFVGRGLPVSQSTETTVGPLRRPTVLVNKRDREASENRV